MQWVSLQTPSWAPVNQHFIVLHPHHKLKYFKDAHWEDNWINTAETLVRDTFEQSYTAWGDSDAEGSEVDIVEVKSRQQKVRL